MYSGWLRCGDDDVGLPARGTGTVGTLVKGLHTWMEEREFIKFDDIRGLLSWDRSRDRSVYTRANYLRILEHYAAA
jgi:hypothetical protein